MPKNGRFPPKIQRNMLWDVVIADRVEKRRYATILCDWCYDKKKREFANVRYNKLMGEIRIRKINTRYTYVKAYGFFRYNHQKTFRFQMGEQKFKISGKKHTSVYHRSRIWMYLQKRSQILPHEKVQCEMCGRKNS